MQYSRVPAGILNYIQVYFSDFNISNDKHDLVILYFKTKQMHSSNLSTLYFISLTLP